MIDSSKVSFMGANLVAQQLDWSMTEGWAQGDAATNDHFRPIGTFEERFAAFIDLAQSVDFRVIDVWTAQLHWAWASVEHLEVAQQVIAGRDIQVASYAGLFGDTVDEVARACVVAKALGTTLLGGNAGALHTDRAAVLALLREQGVTLAIENHPERSPDEILQRIGDDGDVLGAAIDTGWWATRGCPADQAIRALGPHVRHVHLKDVRTAEAHDTCTLGDGVVPIQGCLDALKEIGYDGPVSIEHEPDSYDPTPEVVESRRRLAAWL